MSHGEYRIDSSVELYREKRAQPGANPNSGGQLKLIGMTSTKSARVIVDSTPPELFGESPAAGAIIDAPRPEIRCSFRDTTTQVNPASARILFNGADVTAGAMITGEGFSYTLPQRPDDETHSVYVAVADTVGNRAEVWWSFRVVSAVGIITAATGGTVTVGDPESPIFRTSLDFPPGAVAQDITVLVMLDQSPPDPDLTLFAPAGTCVKVTALVNGMELASLSFNIPVAVTLPYSEAAVQAAERTEDEVRIFLATDNGATPPDSQWRQLEHVQVDATNNLATGKTMEFSFFQPGLPAERVPSPFIQVKHDLLSQKVAVGRKAPNALMVRVIDRNDDDRPMTGVHVTYEVVAGGGFCDAGRGFFPITNPDGLASMVYIAADIPGNARVKATLTDYPGCAPVYFQVEISYPQIAPLECAWPVAASPVQTEWTVAVQDANGFGLEGEKVVFSTSGEASIGLYVAWTDDNGQASARVVCMPGTEAGTITASLVEYPGSVSVPTPAVNGSRRAGSLSLPASAPAAPWGTPTFPAEQTALELPEDVIIVTPNPDEPGVPPLRAAVGIPFDRAIRIAAEPVRERAKDAVTSRGYTLGAQQVVMVWVTGVACAESADATEWQSNLTKTSWLSADEPHDLAIYAKPFLAGVQVVEVGVYVGASGYKEYYDVGGNVVHTIYAGADAFWREYFVVYGEPVYLLEMAFVHHQQTSGLNPIKLYDHETDGEVGPPHFKLGTGAKTPFTEWKKTGAAAPVLLVKGSPIAIDATFSVPNAAGKTCEFEISDNSNIFGAPADEQGNVQVIRLSGSGVVAANGDCEVALTTTQAVPAVGVFTATCGVRHREKKENQGAEANWVSDPDVKSLVFVCNKTPITPPGYKHYAYVAWWACDWAVGLSPEGNETEAQFEKRIVDTLFDKMKDVFEKTGQTLKSGSSGPGINLDYSLPGIPPLSTRQLLLDIRGSCGHWSQFFVDLCKVHRIQLRTVAAVLYPEDKERPPLAEAEIPSPHRYDKDHDVWWYAYDKATNPPGAFPSLYPNWSVELSKMTKDIDGELDPRDSPAAPWRFTNHAWCEYFGAGYDWAYDPSFGKKVDAQSWAGHRSGEVLIETLVSGVSVGSEPEDFYDAYYAYLRDITLQGGSWKNPVSFGYTYTPKKTLRETGQPPPGKIVWKYYIVVDGVKIEDGKWTFPPWKPVVE